MKKLMLFMFLGCSLALNAASEEEKKVNAPIVKVTSTFYGSKASTNANNPCKGSTIRICGKIESSNMAVSDSETLVTTTCKDSEDNVISVDAELMDAPLEDVLKELLLKFQSLPNTEVKIGND